LVRALAERGASARAVELPNDPELGSRDFAELIRQEVGAVASPILLAHSGSGPLLPAAASVLGARHQIWLAAWVPDPEASFVEDVDAHIEAAFNPDWIGKDPIEDDAVAREFLYHDCDEETLEWALSTRRLFRPDWQGRMARERLDVEPIEIPTGHCPNVSQPERLAEILLEVAGG